VIFNEEMVGGREMVTYMLIYSVSATKPTTF